ncbi:MAG: hypothetical protein CMB77_03655 [Euryarchaeota archaeon]|nr:hypothetical protein [Euryarchaeota archaeon]
MQKGASLPPDYETDPWVAAFICELHAMFGTPVTGTVCTNKEDKLQYLWARIGIANALSLHENLWRPLRKKIDPQVAADAFARRYHMITNKMVVEQVPFFSPRGETKALVSPS